MEPIVWSTSRADTAAQCPYKYNKVYNNKIKETSHALTLGSDIHEILAEEIASGNEDVNILQDRLDSLGKDDPELYAMVPNISAFVTRWKGLADKDDLEPVIEQQYAVNRVFGKVDFFDKEAYIRGVFDLWAYDKVNKRLIVIDHKSSKTPIAKKDIATHQQLNLYVAMLTKMMDLDWERAFIALHYVRHGKLLHAWLTRDDMETFAKKYQHYLTVLEQRLVECYEKDYYPPSPGHYCNWCSFKSECPAHVN